jgi:hypothetical protein
MTRRFAVLVNCAHAARLAQKPFQNLTSAAKA